MKTTVIGFRVSEETYQQILLKFGKGGVSEYLRSLIRKDLSNSEPGISWRQGVDKKHLEDIPGEVAEAALSGDRPKLDHSQTHKIIFDIPDDGQET